MRQITWILLLSGAAFAGEELAVVTTTFEITGGMSTMESCAPFGTQNDRYTVHSDAVIRAEGQDVFIINRFQSDNVLSLDAANGYGVHTQFSVGALSNPQDLLMVGTSRAYVTRYESTALWIVNPFSGAKLGEIDLAAYADADGIPEMAQMARVGDRAFVCVQHLDRNDFFTPEGSSTLLVIDVGSDDVVATIPLILQNPDWRLRYAPSVQRLVSVAAGAFSVLDGGVEFVDPFSLGSQGVVLHESSLGGDILDAVIVSPELGWVLHADASFNTILRSFDPRDGSVAAPLLSTSGFYLSDLELSAEGKLYVGDRRPTAPGIRIFDAVTGSSLGGPISVGLPPFDFELLWTTPTATPPSLAGSARLQAFPQPSAGETRFRLLGPAAEGARNLRIVDLRGRLVRVLRPNGSEAGGVSFHWDGLDADARVVAGGRYFAICGDQRIPLSIAR